MLNKSRRILIITASAIALLIVTALILIFSLQNKDKEREYFIYEDFEYTVLENGRIEITLPAASFNSNSTS